MYISVNKKATAEITEKKSRFIAHISHVENEEDAKYFIDTIKKEHYDARHNVYAYILKNGTKKYSDDGEPSKTGGFPVLDLLEKENITDVVCVVTRYFGGTLLGVGGLIRAYSLAAKCAIESAGVSEKEKCVILKITSDYQYLEKIKHIVKSQKAVLDEIAYTDKAVIYVITPKICAENTKQAFTDEFGINIEIEIEKEIYHDKIWV